VASCLFCFRTLDCQKELKMKLRQARKVMFNSLRFPIEDGRSNKKKKYRQNTEYAATRRVWKDWMNSNRKLIKAIGGTLK